MKKKTPEEIVVKKFFTDGRIEDVNAELSLEEMQEFVGGYIEAVATGVAGVVLIVNEDGIRLDLPPNSNATTQVKRGVWVAGAIRGNALLVKLAGTKGAAK